MYRSGNRYEGAVTTEATTVRQRSQEELGARTQRAVQIRGVGSGRANDWEWS